MVSTLANIPVQDKMEISLKRLISRIRFWINKWLLSGVPLFLLLLWCYATTFIYPYVVHFRLGRRYFLLESQIICGFGSWLARTQDMQVYEIGDDLTPCHNTPTLVISNHVSTADTLVMETMSVAYNNFPMYAIREGAQKLMVHIFQKRGMFIVKKKEIKRKERFEDFLRTSIFPIYQWIVIFAEGGLARIVKTETDQFAKKNELPLYKHVTTPHTQGIKSIIQILGETNDEPHSISEPKVQWVLNMTLVYNKNVDYLNIFNGTIAPDTRLYVICQLTPMKEMPRDDKAIEKWIYERFQEKDDILDHFKRTGELPEVPGLVYPHSPRLFIPFPNLFSLLPAACLYGSISLILCKIFDLY